MARLVKAERRDRKRKRVVANQKRGGTVAGQLKKMEISLGYGKRTKRK